SVAFAGVQGLVNYSDRVLSYARRLLASIRYFLLSTRILKAVESCEKPRSSGRFSGTPDQTVVISFPAMWQQNYTPVANSLLWSALIAAVPIFVLLFLIGIRRKPAWMASLAGLAATVALAVGIYGMPGRMLVASV